MGGPLITRMYRIMDLATSKYACTIPSVSEESPYPEPLIREAVLNALVHNDYSAKVPVSLEFGSDSFRETNSFGLPPENSESTVLNSGESVPGNPTMCEVFRITGMTGLAGKGLDSIRKSGTSVTFRVFAGRFTLTAENDAPYEVEIRAKGTSTDELRLQVLDRCSEPGGVSSSELVFDLGLPAKKVTRRFMTPMRKKGLIRFTVPEVPTSSRQRYVITDKGRTFLEENGGRNG